LRRLALVGAVLAGLLALPELAAGATFCVAKPSCVGSQYTADQLQLALDAAATPGPATSRVELGPGDFTSQSQAAGFTYEDPMAPPLTLVGSGVGSTRIHSAGGTVANRTTLAARPFDLVSDLTVTPPAGVPAKTVTGFGGIAQLVLIVPDGGTGITLDADASLTNVLIRWAAPPESESTGIRVSSNPAVSPVVSIDHLTLVGPGAGTTTGVKAFSTATDMSATVNVHDTTVTGVGTPFHAETAAMNAVALISIDHSNYHAAANSVASEGGTATAPLTPGPTDLDADPAFADPAAGDFRLRWNSPLVDHGVPGGGPATDIDGLPRSVDGNGDGVTVRDIGASEYQRRPPVVTTSQSTMTAAVGERVVFNASAAPDADPGEVNPQFYWRFDDKVISGTALTIHTWQTPGTHTAELTVTDVAGASTTVPMTITITPVASPVYSIHGLRMSPTAFRSLRRGGSVVTVGGALLTFTVDGPVVVRFSVEQSVLGRRSGTRCVAQTRANRRRTACRRWVPAGSFSEPASNGPNSLRFSGRINNGRLAPGRYRLIARAISGTAGGTTGGTTGPASYQTFSILR
jgi:hypothetical protein